MCVPCIRIPKTIIFLSAISQPGTIYTCVCLCVCVFVFVCVYVCVCLCVMLH